MNCSDLKSVNIGECVTSIGKEAFASCSNLTTVTIPNSVTNIEENAFRDCNSLTSLTINSPEIGSWFSKMTSIKELTIGDDVKEIGSSAFTGCSGLTSIVIGDNVTSIGSSAFSKCSGLTSLVISDKVISIGSNAFSQCSSLISITIPNGVEKIQGGTFQECTSLTSLTFGNHLDYIGPKAFWGCSELKTAVIPDGVTTIDKAAFMCSGISYLSLPNSLLKIEEQAFDYCYDLLTVVSKIEKPFEIGRKNYDNPFWYITLENGTLYVPLGLVGKYQATKGWNDFLNIMEDNSNGVENVILDTLQIQYNDGILNIQGLDKESQVRVYNTNGILIGSAISHNGYATIETKYHERSVVIVKVGEKSYKMTIK